MTVTTAPLTAAQLQAIFPAAAPDYLQKVAAEVNGCAVAAGLDTTWRRAHFFAQVRQEAGPGLEGDIESLAYSPESLVATFGYYKRNPAEAKVDGYVRDPATRRITRPANQQAIGNKAYALRNGNGDVASGDGFRFRGRGFIQVTGRGNYAAISAQCKALFPGQPVDYVANPDAMAIYPGTLRSAIGFWVQNGCPKLADMGATGPDVDRITKVVNSATDSYPDRRANFTVALRALS